MSDGGDGDGDGDGGYGGGSSSKRRKHTPCDYCGKGARSPRSCSHSWWCSGKTFCSDRCLRQHVKQAHSEAVPSKPTAATPKAERRPTCLYCGKGLTRELPCPRCGESLCSERCRKQHLADHPPEPEPEPPEELTPFKTCVSCGCLLFLVFCAFWFWKGFAGK